MSEKTAMMTGSEQRGPSMDEYFQVLAENAPYGMVVIDGATQTVTYATPAYDRLFRRRPGSSIGRTADDIAAAIHPDDREATLRIVKQAVREHRAQAEYTFRLAEPDVAESERWITNAARFRYAADGALETTYIIAYETTEQKRLERELRQRLSEKTMLIRETNHRVKNNLSLTAALIELKANEIGADFSDIRSRLVAIRSLHEILQYSEDSFAIELAGYLRTVLQRIFSLHPVSVTATVSAAEIEVDSRIATTLGLIVTEIATNAMKHGFVPGEAATFAIDITRDEKKGIMTVTHSGKTLPSTLNKPEKSGLGLSIIAALVDQLRGTIDFDRAPAPVYTITFLVQ